MQVSLAPSVDLGASPTLYANFIQTTSTPHDLTLHLGWYTIPPFVERPEGDNVRVPVQPILKVAIPLSLVTGLIQALQGQLQAWEENFGAPPPSDPTRPGEPT